jgi:hypothetical protein
MNTHFSSYKRTILEHRQLLPSGRFAARVRPMLPAMHYLFGTLREIKRIISEDKNLIYTVNGLSLEEKYSKSHSHASYCIIPQVKALKIHKGLTPQNGELVLKQARSSRPGCPIRRSQHISITTCRTQPMGSYLENFKPRSQPITHFSKLMMTKSELKLLIFMENFSLT